MTNESDKRQDDYKRDWFLLALALLLFCVSTALWLKKNQAPPCWDPADHLRFAYEYYRPLSILDLPGFIREFFFKTHYYAPFYHLLVAALFILTGPGLPPALAVNLFLLAAMMAALYRLGRQLYSREAGLLAAMLAPCYHINAALMHEFFLDFALICWVGISLWILDRAEHFRLRRESIALGLALALGMLCKQPFVFFLGLPVAYVGLCGLRAHGRQAAINIGLALAVSTAVAAIWYLPHLQDVRKIYEINRIAAVAENDPPVLSYFSNMAYIYAFFSQQAQLPLAILFVIGLIASLIWHARKSIPLYLCILGGWLSFTLIANKDIRYTAPFLPAVALLSSCWLGQLRFVWLKATLFILIAAFAAVNFAQAQWPGENEGRFIDTAHFHWAILGRNYLNYDRQPSANSWNVEEILKLIGEKNGHRRDEVRIGVASNQLNFNPSAFALYSLFWNQRGAHPQIHVSWLVTSNHLPILPRCNYIILRDKFEPQSDDERFEMQLLQFIKENPKRFIKIGELPLAETKTFAVIYEQSIEGRKDVEQVRILGSNVSKLIGADAGIDTHAHLLGNDVLPFRVSRD